MNTNEIVRALREECKDCSERNICLKGKGPLYYCPVKQAADLIESLQAQLAERKKEHEGCVLRNMQMSCELAAAQARERAAVECIERVADWNKQFCYSELEEIIEDWRGPQEAGEESR